MVNSYSTRERAPRKRTGFYFPRPDGTERRLREKPHVKIVDAAEGIYAVRSDSDHDVWYQVDSITGLCTCEAPPGRCWHLQILSYYFQPPKPAPVYHGAAKLMELYR